MPRNFSPSPNSQESITRPVVMSIANELIRLLELPPGIKIEYPGGMEQMAQTGSTLQPADSEPSTFQFSNRLHIDVSERFKVENVLTTTVHYNDAQPIFIDPLIGVRVAPVYSQTRLTFTIGIRCKDRSMAFKFRDVILARSAMLRVENTHEAKYSFTVPERHLLMLEQVHTMREAVAGYDEDFSTWVSNHITKRATNLANMAGKGQTLVIQEHQNMIQGWFDWEGAPDTPTKDNDAGTWSWEFTYTADYDKVIGCAAKWPVVVHNQMMPPPWIDEPVANGQILGDPDRRPRRGGRITQALQNFTPHLFTQWCERQTIDGIQIPVNDEFIPDTVMPDTSTVFLILNQIDLTAPRYVLNLGEDLGGFTIDPDVLAHWRENHRYLTRYHESVYHLTLYRNGHPLSGEAITVDAELNVSTVEPMNPRDVYHLRMAMLVDLSVLSPAALLRFRQGGVGAQKSLMTLQWKVLKQATVPRLRGGKWLDPEDLLRYTRALNASKRTYFNGLEYRMLTVSNIIIAPQRSSTDAHHETDAGGADSASTGGTEGDAHPVPQCGGGYPI